MKLKNSLKFEDCQWTVTNFQLVPSEHGPSEELEYNNGLILTIYIMLLLCFCFHFMEKSFVKILQKILYNIQVWKKCKGQ